MPPAISWSSPIPATISSISGLAISPDLDTAMYTLAGLDDPQRGWGRRDETWTFMAALAALGGETWFQLGDGDLATTSSARGGCAAARRYPRSPRISAAAWGSRPPSCR